jgi:conjugal transfer pilus assembly protein TraW
VIRKILFVIALLLSPHVCAKSLGIIGTTYPVAEANLLEVIQARVALLQQQGKLDSVQTELDQHFEQGMDRPTPVAGLSRAQQTRTWLFDPTVASTQNLGETINPLDTVSLKQALLFYDADDAKQVDWVEATAALLNGPMLILVAGSVRSQIARFHKPVYFDQGGRLLERFHLQHVPAIITQLGRHLKIQEVALP